MFSKKTSRLIYNIFFAPGSHSWTQMPSQSRCRRMRPRYDVIDSSPRSSTATQSTVSVDGGHLRPALFAY